VVESEGCQTNVPNYDMVIERLKWILKNLEFIKNFYDY
jgi:hypothetical protein